MEFLRLLCENHYHEMQDYMRTQPDNLRSYNVVRVRLSAAFVTCRYSSCIIARLGHSFLLLVDVKIERFILLKLFEYYAPLRRQLRCILKKYHE